MDIAVTFLLAIKREDGTRLLIVQNSSPIPYSEQEEVLASARVVKIDRVIQVFVDDVRTTTTEGDHIEPAVADVIKTLREAHGPFANEDDLATKIAS